MNNNCEFDHAPNSNLDYGFNWLARGWLDAGETITTSAWEATSGVTLSHQQNLLGITSVFVSGGTLGNIYKLVNTITTLTSNGLSRTDSRTLILSCKNR
jgi:hypothetical protein